MHIYNAEQCCIETKLMQVIEVRTALHTNIKYNFTKYYKKYHILYYLRCTTLYVAILHHAALQHYMPVTASAYLN
jgi:hypothetical protein